jgi:hypothetical protein
VATRTHADRASREEQAESAALLAWMEAYSSPSECDSDDEKGQHASKPHHPEQPRLPTPSPSTSERSPISVPQCHQSPFPASEKVTSEVKRGKKRRLDDNAAPDAVLITTDKAQRKKSRSTAPGADGKCPLPSPEKTVSRATATRGKKQQQQPKADSEKERLDIARCHVADPLLAEQPQPAPVLVEREGITAPEWHVQGIVNSKLVERGRRRRLEYLVDWTGYDNTWQPRYDLIPGCERLVARFHKDYPDRPSPASLDVGRPLKRRGRPPSGKIHKRARLGV